MVMRPDAAEHVLGEVARGVSGGLLFAGVKTLSRLSRPWRAGAPWWSWWCCGWAISRSECRNALIGSFLLGLLLAVASVWGGGH